MTIATGETFPAGQLLKLGENGPEPVDTASLTGRVAIFGVPGAFTGTCTTAHMPSFIRTADQFREKGVGRIVCLTVNDPFVADAWAKTVTSDSRVKRVPAANWRLSGRCREMIRLGPACTDALNVGVTCQFTEAPNEKTSVVEAILVVLRVTTSPPVPVTGAVMRRRAVPVSPRLKRESTAYCP